MLWLFPLTYAIHVAEELWAGEGFPAWIARLGGAPLPVDVFLTINAIGMLLMIAAAAAGTRDAAFAWTGVTLAGIVTINAAAHALMTLVLGVYSPGVVSGLLLWGPLGIITLARTRRQLPPPTWWRALIAGIVIHGIVTALAIAST